jgi:hypothetical protein
MHLGLLLHLIIKIHINTDHSHKAQYNHRENECRFYDGASSFIAFHCLSEKIAWQRFFGRIKVIGGLLKIKNVYFTVQSQCFLGLE